MAGQQCIEVSKTSVIATISEVLCIGCNMCVRKCPFGAIKIINLPKDLSKEVTHRYGPNAFKLHRLPTPRPGQVLGLVGTNGIGKSTALKILAGKVKPNLGIYKAQDAPDWPDIIKYFRGSELQSYFNRLNEEKLIAVIKPQYVDTIPKHVKGNVGEIIAKKDDKKIADRLVAMLDLDNRLNRTVEQLSGGELQRFAILITSIQNADVIMYDEPSSYLDVKQRLAAAHVIRDQIEVGQGKSYIICVEHDLSVLDYLSDFVCCLYGEQTAYGIVTMPFSVREGINIFLAGFVPTENMRFRDYELSFKVSQDQDELKADSYNTYKYPAMHKVFLSKDSQEPIFSLNVRAGSFKNSQITVLVGENGTGKTTFIKMLAGKDKDFIDKVPELNVSYKPQMIAPKFESTVHDLLIERLKNSWQHPQFQTDVAKPMMLDDILENLVQDLSGGELQRVAMVLALGKPADVYLIDEPSAYLDSEQRIHCARCIKRFILNAKKACFVVEHDFIMATYLADQIIVFEGDPGRECIANEPQDLVSGMNKFLSLLAVTFRRDPTNYRPRINKLNSEKDRE